MMTSRIGKRLGSGFTLIELLVVIAIIAILAAILLPVFAQARAKARQTSCLSDLKQIDTAFQMYAQDYDETFPVWQWWYSSDAGGCPRSDNPAACGHFGSLWINSLYPYIKSAGVYTCPSDRGTLSPTNSALYWWVKQSTPVDPNILVNQYGFQQAIINQQLSFGANEPLLGWTGNTWGTMGKMPAIDRPAQTLLVADSITSYVCCPSGKGTGPGGRPNRNDPTDPTHRYIMRRVAYANQSAGTWWGGDQTVAKPEWDGEDSTRHSAGENIGFADGHAKWMRANQITEDLYLGDQAGG